MVGAKIYDPISQISLTCESVKSLVEIGKGNSEITLGKKKKKKERNHSSKT